MKKPTIKKLLRQWSDDVIHHSSTNHIMDHKNVVLLKNESEYDKQEVIEAVLEHIQGDRYFSWGYFVLLYDLTDNANPLDPQHRGNFIAIKDSWMKWGIENGYLETKECK
jgi:hypothetical protein